MILIGYLSLLKCFILKQLVLILESVGVELSELTHRSDLVEPTCLKYGLVHPKTKLRRDACYNAIN